MPSGSQTSVGGCLLKGKIPSNDAHKDKRGKFAVLRLNGSKAGHYDAH